jgi:hypothetical protein
MPEEGALTTLVLAQGVKAAQQTALAALLADLTQRATPQPAPITSTVFLLGDPALSAVKQALRAPDGSFAVQESQSFLRCHGVALAAGDEVLLYQEHSTAATRLRFGLGEEGAQLETRVKFLSAAQIREMAPPRFSDRMAPAAAQVIALAPLGADPVARYLALAHDDNPIHTDDVRAQEAGFAGAIVPGMLFCALAESLCGATQSGLTISDVRARFLSAARVGALVRCILSPFAGGATQKSRIFVVGESDQIHAIIDVFATRTPDA